MLRTAAGVWLGIIAVILTPAMIILAVLAGAVWTVILVGGLAAVGMIGAGLWIIVRDWPRGSKAP